ncbi:hypothetical protein [Streptomyces broussonetiae]|uniref:hypothetical protein n=1 Tax=Streptomyces broussonetiae TaxID=2686304 RepID=UPI003899B306
MNASRRVVPGPPGAASWRLKWSPSARTDGLGAFETVGDDRAHSHPAGHPHICASGDDWRFTTHTADRVRPKWGIRSSLGDTYLLLTDLRGYQLA